MPDLGREASANEKCPCEDTARLCQAVCSNFAAKPLVNEQSYCCRKDWHSSPDGALLRRPGAIAAPVSNLADAGLKAVLQMIVARSLSRQRKQEIPLRTIETEAVAGPQPPTMKFNPNDRRHFIGGSDARIVMGDDQDALLRLWREKRGEIEPEDLSDNLIVQLGTATEVLNRACASGHTVKDIQRRVRHPVHKWMGATLDGIVEQTGAVFEAKFMLPWAFSEEAAAEKHMAQLQHNMWVMAACNSVLSIITGGGKWMEIKIHADPLYQHLLLTAERKFWRGVQTGEPPVLFNIETPRPRLEPVKVVDMSTSNQWADLAASYLRTREAHGEHETAKTELKKLIPQDAKEAAGHGIKAKRSKSGAISFEAQVTEGSDAPIQ